jgi:hypothetical protein
MEEVTINIDGTNNDTNIVLESPGGVINVHKV